MDGSEGREGLLKELCEEFSSLPEDVVRSVVEVSLSRQEAFVTLCDMFAEASIAYDPDMAQLEAETKIFGLGSCEAPNQKRRNRGVVLSMAEIEANLGGEAERNDWSENNTLHNKFKVQELKKRYPSVDDNVISDLLSQADGDSTIAEGFIVSIFDPKRYELGAGSSQDVSTNWPVSKNTQTGEECRSNESGTVSKSVVMVDGLVDNSRQISRTLADASVAYRKYESSLVLAQRVRTAEAYQICEVSKKEYDDLFDKMLSLLSRDITFNQKTSIDLHGLNVEDALKLVSLKLDCEERIDSRSGKRIEFITGRGEPYFSSDVLVPRKHVKMTIESRLHTFLELSCVPYRLSLHPRTRLRKAHILSSDTLR
uniref:CUE domain-containing protein n=1 Tax=Rhodosorus marinus TaxID=101924 RepID=A0A6T6KHV2_9RHOD|mmetsp:Transcript_11829/g.17145  ORF Transcript_11829/g.17145 Transcript_11829/m.17145 type:complete len:369 (+) Transcript_11829:91-1197(+)